MSYLHAPRLIFAGDFQADVNTVNNDVRHYDNRTFQERFQELYKGKVQNGWFNPDGGGAFWLVNCSVTRATTPDGHDATTNAEDPVVGKLMAGPADRSGGKMVDLDPQMQMVSQLWGVALRIYTPDNELLLQGDVEPTGFRDLLLRQFGDQKPNGQPLGATWTSVLTNLEWGPLASNSPVLAALRQTIQEDVLALRLTSFGYYALRADGRFAMGRLLGVIGPYAVGEPRTFAPARRLLGTSQAFGYTNAVWDEARSRLMVDFGASFPVVDPFGAVQDVGPLQLAVGRAPSPPTKPSGSPEISPSDVVVIGEIAYRDGDWLADTGGLVTLPVAGEAATLLRDHPILLLGKGKTSDHVIVARESTQGLAVRADQFVQRLDAGQSAAVDFYAYQWGRPLANGQISLSLAAPAQPGGGPSSDPKPPTAKIPYTNIPADAVQFPSVITTDDRGRATLLITGKDPGNPRDYIDGQIYEIVYQLDGLPRADQYKFDQVMVHLRDSYVVPPQPRWRDVKPILQQYGNLYPLMSRHIVDLGNRDQVLAKRDILLFAFTREEHDPLYMPVTRDLSAAKRDMVIEWLRSAPEKLEEEELDAAAAPAAVRRRAMLEPTAEDLKRLHAVVMRSDQFDAMTEGEGGKAAALRMARDAIRLEDEA